MDLKDALIHDRSKANMQAISAWIGQEEDRFAQLWELVRTGADPMPQRASWAMSHCYSLHPTVVHAFIPEMAAFLFETKIESVQRNIVRILSKGPLDGIENDGNLYELCLGWLRSEKTAIAIRIWSMDVAARIAEPYPELREEVRYHIETILPHGSAGFKSRSKKILKRFTKLSSAQS
ncbi:MAG: hypothetical protein AAF399_22570 [Bacteroidota bacterium]